MTTEEPTTPADDLAAVIHQPSLPDFELPEYHGRKPVGMKTALTGAGTRVTRPHTIGDRIVLVIEARVKKASHEDTDDGLVYAESLKVLDLFELSGDQGARLISTVRSLYRTAEDAVKGRRPIPELGDTGYTDSSGVVLTAAEVAELRGDPVRAMLSLDLQPAVIVYEDGARDLWPDDYPKDAPRPQIGERYLTDSGDVLVTKLLHHETGEELASLDELPAGDERLEDLPEEPSNVIELRPSGEIPELPEEPDAFAGELGDDVDSWETPERAVELDPADDLTPTSVDFAFVDRSVDGVRDALRDVDELAHAIRILRAEQEGRGRGLKPRAGALSWIEAKIVELGGNAEEVRTRGA